MANQVVEASSSAYDSAGEKIKKVTSMIFVGFETFQRKSEKKTG